MDLIDTHQHLIARNRFGYAWTNGIPALAQGDFLAADFQQQVRGLRVVAALFMETGVDDADYKAEARHVAGLIGSDGLVGQIASCRPETEDGFEEWLDECASLKVHGFRRILHVMPDELSQSPTFRSNLRKLAARGFPFDLCVLARQLAIAEALVASCPDVTFILNHCGVPDIAGNAFEPWAEGIRRISAHPNVSVKLSGITAYCRPGDNGLATLRPWVDHVLDCFGPSRMIWGSDWPVVTLGSGLLQWITLTNQLLAGLSDDDRQRIGTANARRVYNL